MAPTEQKQSDDRFPLYVALAFSLAMSFLNYENLLYGFDKKWVDQMFRWRGAESGDARITLIAIDDDSLKKVGAYPWPRRVYPRLLDRLFHYGASVVGMDILFLDPSNPVDDEALVAAARKWKEKLVLSATIDDTMKSSYVFRYPFDEHPFDDKQKKYPSLRSATKYFGLVNQLKIDGDGAVRLSYKIIGHDINDDQEWVADPKHLPVLGVQVLSVYEKKSIEEYAKSGNVIQLNIRGQKDTNVAWIQGDGDKHGVPSPITKTIYGINRIPAWKVLENDQLQPDELKLLKGSIILVGSTAEGAYDHYPNPFTGISPGVEVHANIIDNILNHRELRGITWWKTTLFIFVFAFLAVWAVSLHPLTAASVIVGAVGFWALLNYVAFRHLMVMDFTAPSLSLLGTFATLMIRQTLTEQKQKKFIKQTFGQFVAPEVVEDLVRDPGKVKLGGEKREMTVFFLDIAHFTTISEKMAPEALILFLNKYLSALSHVIHQHQGVVDKYIGDCIMAFWNAPLEQKDHRVQACLAAVECQDVMADLNTTLDSSLPEKPAIRIGLNSGDVTVGLTGSQQKLQYTVIGDEVNLASRLEGANKFFGSKIMVSESCYSEAKDAVEGRLLGEVRVVGKEKPIRVYELLAAKGKMTDGWKTALPLYDKGVSLFVQAVDFVKKKDSAKSAAKFGEAKAAFGEVLKILPNDGPARFYANVSEDYSQIPPMDWDGVFNLTTK